MKKYKGAIWNTLGSLMYGMNSFIMLTMVSRFGSVEQTGCFGIAFTTAQILYIIGLFGVSNYQMTDYQEKYTFLTYAKVRVISCMIMLVGCLIAIRCMKFTGTKLLYTVVLTVLMIVNVIGDLYQNLFFQRNRLDLSGSALFYRTFWSLMSFCLVFIFSKRLLLAIIIQIAVNLMVTLYYVVVVASSFEPYKNRLDDKEQIKNLFKECLPLFASLLLMNIIINSSKYGIDFWMNDTAQGYYNMIFMPAQVINLCSQFFFKPLLNQYADLLARKKLKKFFGLFFKQIGIIAIFTVVCCLGAYILGIPILEIIYHKDLSEFRWTLTMVVLGGGVFAICQLFYYIFVILRKQKYILGIYLFSFFIAAAITYVLVNKGGILGASISFVGAHIVILICYCIAMARIMKLEK